MWKNLLQRRHVQRASERGASEVQQQYRTGPARQGPPGVPQQQPQLPTSLSPDWSVGPVEYTASPPLAAPSAGALMTLTPIPYAASPPPNLYPSAAERGPYYEVPLGPQQTNPPDGYSRTKPVFGASATVEGRYLPVHELPGIASPQELPATSIFHRQEPSLPSTPSTRTQASYSTYSGQSSLTGTSPVTAATTPPYSLSTIPNTLWEPENISKYTVRAFCQRKSARNQTQIEEIPRDIREFRTVKLTLIRLTAGTERYALLDIVFGEIDGNVAALLEKHFVVTPSTTISTLHGEGLGDGTVKEISKLQVAYTDLATTVYVVFTSEEEEAKFLSEFQSAQRFIKSR